MKWLDKAEEWIIIAMLAAMTLLTFTQVVLRYVFNHGWTWALELTTIFFAVMIFVGISYGVRVGAHIGIDALVTRFGPAARRAVSIFVVVLCLVYAGLIIYGSLFYVSKMYEVGVEMEDMPIQIWVVRSILPLGYGLLALRYGQVLWSLLSGKVQSLHLGDEVAEAMKLRAKEETT